MSINEFDGTLAYFVISRMAGGEILESYSKNPNFLQPLLEYSLSYIESFQSIKSDISSWNQNISQYNHSLIFENLKQITLSYNNIKVFFTEIKEDDIFVVNFFDCSYPEGIIKIFLSEYLSYVKQTYSF
ncbi:MAG: hypothetical protein ABDH21_03380 [bacterium]